MGAVIDYFCPGRANPRRRNWQEAAMIKTGFVTGIALSYALLIATPTGARGQSARLAEELRGPSDLGGDWSPESSISRKRRSTSTLVLTEKEPPPRPMS